MLSKQERNCVLGHVIGFTVAADSKMVRKVLSIHFGSGRISAFNVESLSAAVGRLHNSAFHTKN